MTTTRGPVYLMVLTICVTYLAAGCGIDVLLAPLMSFDSVGRSVLDVAITDLANALGDALDAAGLENAVDTGSSGDGNLGDDEIPSFEGLTGDPQVGSDVFTSLGCFVCHCPTATGGCRLDALDIRGVPALVVHFRTRGNVPHPGGKFDLTDQEIVDLAALLDSLK